MNGTEDDKGNEMTSGPGIVERDLLQRELRALPDTPPPREVWRRIERQARAEGLFGNALRLYRARWLAGAAIAAAVALAVLRLPPFGGDVPDDGPFPTEPAFTESSSARNLDTLMVRSQILERNLRSLPSGARVMRAGTAATISELEDRIAAIDYALNDPRADLTTAEAEVFWRERVRLMDSLLQVRYAQARRVSF